MVEDGLPCPKPDTHQLCRLIYRSHHLHLFSHLVFVLLIDAHSIDPVAARIRASELQERFVQIRGDIQPLPVADDRLGFLLAQPFMFPSSFSPVVEGNGYLRVAQVSEVKRSREQSDGGQRKEHGAYVCRPLSTALPFPCVRQGCVRWIVVQIHRFEGAFDYVAGVLRLDVD